MAMRIGNLSIERGSTYGLGARCRIYQSTQNSNKFTYDFLAFCHLQVKRPTISTGTTVIKFTEMKARNSIFKNCRQGNRVVITGLLWEFVLRQLLTWLCTSDITSGPWQINEVVCNASKTSNETTFILPNYLFDIYVINNPHKLFIDTPLEFKMIVKFYRKLVNFRLDFGSAKTCSASRNANFCISRQKYFCGL